MRHLLILNYSFSGSLAIRQQFASSSRKLSKVQLGLERVVKSTKRVISLLGPAVIIVHKQLYRVVVVPEARQRIFSLCSSGFHDCPMACCLHLRAAM